ncbi:Hypothetical predicted protein [Xyrichtys novacula]|uniref:Uncharacterized protein n=1 Tax=Xyrichtys novacula TaxID=13765 RepID=A0AAV1EMY6_XYRNO|nr:Hypothetical predicted protein [Xyrichtys novacula]
MTAVQHQHLPPLTTDEQDMENVENFTDLRNNISNTGERLTDQNWQSCRGPPMTLEHLVVEIHHHGNKATTLYVSGHPHSDLRL